MDKKFNYSDIVGYLAIILIVVSLFFIGLKLTGYTSAVTSTGTVNVTVSSTGSINFTTNNVNFGTGFVSNGVGATINTGGTATNWTNTSVMASGPLILQNIGNQNVTLVFSAAKNASGSNGMINGTSPSFAIKVTDRTGYTGACVGAALTSYTELYTSNSSTACAPLQFYSTLNTVDVNVQLYIPQNSANGSLSNTITATGTY